MDINAWEVKIMIIVHGYSGHLCTTDMDIVDIYVQLAIIDWSDDIDDAGTWHSNRCLHRINIVETKWYTVVLVIIGIRNLQPIYNCHLMYHHAINDNTLQSIALSPDTTDNIIRIFCISSAKNTWMKTVFGRLKVTKWFSLGPLPQSPPDAWSAYDTW